jgi:hypothetical protein
MILLIDTDIFCKLGLAGILKEAAALFGVPLTDCGRLPALPHMLRRGGLRKRYGAQTCDALLPLAEQVPPVDEAAAEWLDRFTHVEGIDPGEAQLYALAAERQLSVLTDDKRALQALKEVVGAPEALSGRVAVLESVLLVLCEQRGIEDVRARMAALSGMDLMVQTCFSLDNTDPREGLRSYLAAITVEVHPLLLWRPGSPT